MRRFFACCASKAVAITEQDIAALSAKRQRIIRTVSRLSRLAKFQKMVLNAYDSRCAVTRFQLRLVDAAHILPVGAPGSFDDVRKGIALAPTYHRAYDNALIFLDHDFQMRINPAKVDELNRMNLTGGRPAFRASLSRILLPQDQRQWPHPNLIKKANEFRGINDG